MIPAPEVTKADRINMINKSDFTFITKQKGKSFGIRKITNNSNYIIFHKGNFIGEVRSQKDAISFIDNLVKHQKLEYTPM